MISSSAIKKQPSTHAANDRTRSFPIGSLEGRAENQSSTVLSAKMLQNATREAGAFQRSALGHIEHRDWLDRVRADGQRLTDLLREMGFIPTERS